MELFPAIDLRGGTVVRLHQGDFDEETTYGHNPLEVAQTFADAGARWIHVVDLDAALSGEAMNRKIIGEMATLPVRIQTGGGVRDKSDVEELFELGATRVVMGTPAITRPDAVLDLARQNPGRIAIGLDARQGHVATRGWIEQTSAIVSEVAARFDDPTVAALVVTDIARDGAMTGPDVEGLSALLTKVEHVDVIASGGVSSVEDLRTLASLRVDGRKLAGAVVGRAIYEKAFTIEEGMDACALSG